MPSRTVLVEAIVVAVTIGGGIYYLGGLEERIKGLDVERIRNAQDNALSKIEGASRNFEGPLPPGTIMASVLNPELFLTDGREHQWHLADASSIPPNSKYLDIIREMGEGQNVSIESANGRLPDLRGVFLRGMSAGRRDGNQDPNGDDRLAGSYQSGATKLPNAPFTGETLESGEHRHNYRAPRDYRSGAGSHARAKPDGGDQTEIAGLHTHRVEITSGGDVETRPANISVYFYIKIN